MSDPIIESIIEISGSAFCGNSTLATRPINALKNQNLTNYVSLAQWCAGNFITRRVGYQLIKRKFLIAQKLYGQWWVCSNPDCLEELLNYLNVSALLFDAENL
jgi:hypothetical protein